MHNSWFRDSPFSKDFTGESFATTSLTLLGDAVFFCISRTATSAVLLYGLVESETQRPSSPSNTFETSVLVQCRASLRRSCVGGEHIVAALHVWRAQSFRLTCLLIRTALASEANT